MSLRLRSSERALVELGTAAGLFLLAWGIAHAFFWAHGQIVDTPTYQQYGDAIVHGGQVPYRDFAIEYPPGALPPFILPALTSGYDATFGWLMAACGLAVLPLVQVLRPAALWFVALSPVLIGSLAYTRFDLWPALLSVAALVALARDRHALGFALLGAAFAVKLWPAVLVPLALVWTWRRRRSLRPALAGVAVALAAFLPFAVLAPHGLEESLHRQAARPLQVESLGASLLVELHLRDHVVTSYGSQNLAGSGADAAAVVSTAAQIAALVAVWVLFARGPAQRDRLVRHAAAAVAAFIAFGKVFSPQFLIWLVPLVPLVRGRRGLAATGLLAAALVLTQVWFPWRYWSYGLELHRGLGGVVLARDLAVVALLVVLAWPRPQSSA